LIDLGQADCTAPADGYQLASMDVAATVYCDSLQPGIDITFEQISRKYKCRFRNELQLSQKAACKEVRHK